MEIAALIGHLAMPRRHRLAATLPILRTTTGVLQPPLCGRQLVGCGAPPAGILHVLPIARGGETSNTDIDADRPTCTRKRSGRHVITGQDEHPAAALAANLKRFYSPRHHAVSADLDLPDAFQIHP